MQHSNTSRLFSEEAISLKLKRHTSECALKVDPDKFTLLQEMFLWKQMLKKHQKKFPKGHNSAKFYPMANSTTSPSGTTSFQISRTPTFSSLFPESLSLCCKPTVVEEHLHHLKQGQNPSRLKTKYTG
ncbi:hypothetical protein CHS0354_031499 [Potamilus streckersoni]|uniref:Uncharacterized protein n=1 Tax=Potamilus streckersoni TaxID=2493646 RepID=A0AAE0SHS8_9BIVA|nr:hypothetical protein CHS0354_031499 [Potamilus streckersoni]